MGAGAESFGEIKVIVGFDDFVRNGFDTAIAGVNERIFLADDRHEFIEADVGLVANAKALTSMDGVW